jgi:hypothetical protein
MNYKFIIKENMKIKISKKQWEEVGKKTGWLKKSQIQIIEMLDLNNNVIPKSTVDQEILDRLLGKHTFDYYVMGDIESNLQEKYNYHITVDGMSVNVYLRQKMLKKYNL